MKPRRLTPTCKCLCCVAWRARATLGNDPAPVPCLCSCAQVDEPCALCTTAGARPVAS